MRDIFTLTDHLYAEFAGPIDYVDPDHKEYKLVFNIYSRADGLVKQYSVYVTKRHLLALGYEDTRYGAFRYTVALMKQRFFAGPPEENAAYCHGKIIEYLNLSPLP
jgi:hypothetical protein